MRGMRGLGRARRLGEEGLRGEVLLCVGGSFRREGNGGAKDRKESKGRR